MPRHELTYRGIKIFSEGRLWFFFYKGDKFVKIGQGTKFSIELAQKTIDWFKDGNPLLYKKSMYSEPRNP